MTLLHILSSNPTGHLSYLRSPARFQVDLADHLIINNLPETINWTCFRNSQEKQVMYVQHPCTPQHVQAIKLAKLMNVKVWIDWAYDPFMLSIPGDPAFEYMSNSEISASVIECMRLADYVTSAVDFSFIVPSSSPVIKRRTVMLPDICVTPVAQNKVVFRSSKNWEKELWEDAAEIAYMMEAGFQLHVFAPARPWFLDCENLFFHGHLSPPAYYAWLANEKPICLLRRTQDTDHFKSFDHSNVGTAEQILAGKWTVENQRAPWKDELGLIDMLTEEVGYVRN